jgi:hypothetical protein
MIGAIILVQTDRLIRNENAHPSAALRASISFLGIAQPILVSESEFCASTGRYVVESGHRRAAAAAALGLSEVPCVIVVARSPFAYLAENWERMPIAEAGEAVAGLFDRYQEYGNEHGFTARLASAVGCSETEITALNRLRRDLHPAIWKQLHERAVPRTARNESSLLMIACLVRERQVAAYNAETDPSGGARRGSEGRPGPAKLRKMMARASLREKFPEGAQFAAGAEYALGCALGEPWRHGGIQTPETRRKAAHKRETGNK